MGIIAKYFESVSMRAAHTDDQLPLTDQEKIAQLLSDVDTLKSKMSVVEPEIDALQVAALGGDSLSQQALDRLTALEAPFESVSFTVTNNYLNGLDASYSTLDEGVYLIKAQVDAVAITALVGLSGNYRGMYFVVPQISYGSTDPYDHIYIDFSYTSMKIRGGRKNWNYTLTSINKVNNW